MYISLIYVLNLPVRCSKLLTVLQAPNNAIEFEIIGDEDAGDYFYINPTSGAISLLQSVLETNKNIYRVSVDIASFVTYIHYCICACIASMKVI